MKLNKNNYDIAKIYQEMEIHLIESMKNNLSRHIDDEIKEGFSWPQWQAEKLKELKRYQRQNSKIISSYTNLVDKSVTQQLKSQFKEGSKSSQKDYEKKYDKKMRKSFFGINDKKINNLISSVNNDLALANQATLRMINDEYRQVIHKAAMFSSNGVLTEKKAIDMATKDFLSRGLNSIQYSNGARVNIASYAQMAVNTANQRAQLQGSGEFRKKIGNPLVKITKHGTACKLCQPWEGKILIDDVYSGGTTNDGDYPLLSDAMKKGLYHPNCRHGIGTYYPELYDIEFDENGATSKTQKNYQEDLNYCNLQIQRFKRLETGSLANENRKIYYNKKVDWENKKQFIKYENFSSLEEYSEENWKEVANKIFYTKNDFIIEQLAKENGFDGLPIEVSKSEYKRLLNDGNIKMQRVVSTNKANTAEYYRNQFINGKYHSGTGLYGNGIYASIKESDITTYSTKESAVIKMALSKDAKVLKFADEYDEYKYIANDLKNYKGIQLKIMEDPGRNAIIKGYDAIYIQDKGYYVILNRTKVYVEE